MSEYLDADIMTGYVTDTDLNKYAVKTTETDTIKLRNLDNWSLVVNDAEIYLDSFMHRRGLEAYTTMDQVLKPIRRLLGGYISYKLALDRIANNPQQNLTDLSYDLYKNKLDSLKEAWKASELDITDFDFTGVDEVEESSTNTINLHRR